MTSVTVKKSAIHRHGVFAARNFAKGEMVTPWANTCEITEAEYHMLPPAERGYIEIRNHKIFLVGEPERYVNHSCDANTAAGDHGDVALRAIEAGEEITCDFGNFFIPEGSFDCTCGSTKCRGRITGRPSESTL